MRFLFILLLIVPSWATNSCTTRDKLDWKRSVSEGSYVAVDVRSKAEIEKNPALGSIHVPMNRLKGGLDGIDKSKTVLLFCEKGVRASWAKRSLLKSGFKKVVNIGSWRDWNEYYANKKR